ncbi:hypothetical protein BGZ96_010271 [Linnemannia gamsii]|uniref:C2H2-type domain-containing protein n=1 Tax=Linnemannia gamsii TaxID=64522 RepID=A0ABQ7JUU1_9FUNG|nr:hypothetical protein BGZ96_010271 [Linnemannia gamsii]
MIPLPYHHPTKALLNRPVVPVTQLSLDTSAYRSVSFDRLSSPEALSPISDQGFFDMTTDDETVTGSYSSMMIPSNMHPNSNKNNSNNSNGNNNNSNNNNSNNNSTNGDSNKNDTIAIEYLNISGSASTTSLQRRRRTPPSLVHKSAPAATLKQIMLLSPDATAALNTGPITMSSPLPSSSSSSLSNIPALSSPLKQHFNFSTSLSDSDSREEEEEGVAKTGSASRSSSKPAAKKKRERKPSKSGHNKPKHPPVKLPCHFPDCKTTCSSQPSLARHAEAHKWRGIYAPVRCEACQSALSNEFSVQRHIVRSPRNSACRRLRVYSIMMSETEIETSVRFYPNRAHGKKTVEINLDYARAHYLGDPPQ